LRAENAALRQQVAELQAAVAIYKQQVETEKTLIERQRLEKALQESEERYQQLFELSTNAFATFTVSGIFTSVNRGVERMLGYTRDEMVGQPYWKFLTPASSAQVREQTRRFLAGERVSSFFEMEVIRKDGAVITVEARSNPIYDATGKLIGFQGGYGDITIRKQAEKARQKSEASYRTLVSNLPNGAVQLFDHDLRFLLCAGPEIASLSSSEEPLEGKTIWEVYPPEICAQIEPAYRAVLAGESTLTELVYAERIYRLSGAPIRDEQGKIWSGMVLAQNITAQKHTEAALRESETRYRELFENANDGIAVVKLDRTIVSINRALEHLLGWSRDELIGQDYYRVLTPAGRALAEERAQRLQNGEKIPSIFEHEFLRKDGTTVPVEGRIRFIRDRTGAPIGFQGAYRDITERKRMEEELRRSQQQYQALVHSIDGVVWEVDVATFQFTFVSPQAEQLLGYPKERWLTEPGFWANHIHPEDREWAIHFCLVETAEKRPHQFDYRILAADGRVVWLHDLVTVVVEDGRPVKLRGVMSDITARKQVEQMLQAERNFALQVMNAMGQGLVVTNTEHSIEYINPAAAHMFGYQPEEVIGKSFMSFAAPDDLPLLVQEAERQKRGETTTYEIRVKHADGRDIPVLISGATRWREGALTGAIVVITDLTERKRAEEERQQLQTQLLQAQKLEAIGTLTGGIAHDFNNILLIMLGNTELALEDVPVGAAAYENLQEVLKAGRRAKTFVQQLLTFGRPDRHGQRPLLLQPVLEDTLSFLRASLLKTVTLRTDFSCPTGPVLADPTQIQQLLVNLCINAVQAMQEKGGILQVRLQRITAEELQREHSTTAPPGWWLKLVVRDTGCGMAPEVMERVFEPFFTTKPLGEGTGLGLAMVHGIVRNHGGIITVKSQPGQGTTFQVYLPEIDSVIPASVLSSESGVAAHGAKKFPTVN
jgi:PAS domain S-box-containing protein